MAWRPANSLVVLHEQLKRGSRAAPPATPTSAWGTIGDAAHDPTSDHAPHDFPGWGNDIVTAADFPNRPDLGLDAHRVLDDIRRSRDARVKYGISNDQIFSSYATNTRAAWTWGPYNRNDPNRDRHYDHGHLSVVGDARADDRRPWATIGANIMDWSDKLRQPGDGSANNPAWDSAPAEWSAASAGEPMAAGTILGGLARRVYLVYAGMVATFRQSKANGSALSALTAKVDALSAPVPVEMTEADREDIANRVVSKLGALRFEADSTS